MDIRWSRHALERAAQMGVEPEVVEAALSDFSHSYPNPPHHPAGRVFVAGAFAVPVSPDGMIMTVLWAGRTGRAA